MKKLAVIALLLAVGHLAQAAESLVQLTVYKSPTCGCCGAWVDHMEKHGYSTSVVNTSELSPLKLQLGIKPRLQSCHTAVSSQGQYVFEGHIPALIVDAFLKNPPPDAIGLTVPGMPVGSPGMEMGEMFQPYDVLLIKKDGSTEKYARVTNPLQQYSLD